MADNIQSFMVCGTRFDIPAKYTLIKPIGQGAYGVVCSAINNENQRKVAIKKIAKAFDHLTDSKRTLREIKLLRHFRHENVLYIEDIFKPPNYEDFEDVYIVSELMDTDLHQIIGSPQPLTDDHCQYFLYQILRGLKYIHSSNVLHRDLKPSNLLLNGNCDLKICDFGLARLAKQDETHAGFMTEYVATRWYRAPEIMLSWKEYTKAIDMWSVGCIFAELIGRKALFPGRDYIHQLNLITDLLGTPDPSTLDGIGSDQARRYVEGMPRKPKVPLASIFPEANPVAIDLLEKMLVFDPSKRIDCETALAHPYLASLHDPNDEPTCHAIYEFPFENVPLNTDLVKELIYKEMMEYHPETKTMFQQQPVFPQQQVQFNQSPQQQHPSNQQQGFYQ
eukprot:Nk52_evm18s164 gene=Nk52_evmTU18s164